MWENFFNHLIDAFAIVLTGLVIKISDDYIDRDKDQAFDYNSFWLKKLGRGALPYSVIIFAVAVTLNANLSISLYLSAFITGMFKETDVLFPSGLKGYQEIAIIFVLGLVICGGKAFCLSLLLILLVQTCDDLMDYKIDKTSSARNLFIIIGKAEGLVLLAILLILNFFYQPFYAFITLSAMWGINRLSTQVKSGGT